MQKTKRLNAVIILLLSLTGCAATPCRSPCVTPPVFSKWHRVLEKQPIVSGTKTPTYNDIVIAKAKIKKFKYKTDMENWGVEDYWATPKEMIKKGAGDCEDFVIYEYYALRAAGFSKDDLEFWVVESNDFMHITHAILIVKFNGVKYLLDSQLSIVEPWEGSKNMYTLLYNPKE